MTDNSERKQLTESEKGIVQWLKDVKDVQDKIPEFFNVGPDESLIKVETLFEEGKRPMMFVRLKCNMVVGTPPSWSVVRMDDPDSKSGLKGILVQPAFTQAMKKFGLTNKPFGVRGIRLLGRSASRNSVAIEIAQW